TPQDAVRDAAPRAGRFPLVAFSHGYGGHRRQSTFLCTHLASHGYVVVSADHAGNTVLDALQAFMGGARQEPRAQLEAFVATRPPCPPGCGAAASRTSGRCPPRGGSACPAPASPVGRRSP